ncbi:MAG: acyl-CoA desaturase, partial [Acidimicrobiales bacterium]
AHRSYRTSRLVQFLLAFGGTTAVQKGPLWWAAQHRLHHRATDTPRDPHTPQKGLWWSHVGWVLSNSSSGTDLESIADITVYPELRFINRFDWIGPWALAIACFLVGGWSGLVIGFFLSTVLLWHGTFTVNSLAHTMGRRRYATPDTSRNSALITLITGGEGWHNNHHHFPMSARLGFFWWEVDPTWCVLRLFAAVGIVSDLRAPPQTVRAKSLVADGAFDIGMFRARLAKASLIVNPAHRGDAHWLDQRAHIHDSMDSLLQAAERLAKAARTPISPTAIRSAVAERQGRPARS